MLVSDIADILVVTINTTQNKKKIKISKSCTLILGTPDEKNRIIAFLCMFK